MTVYVVQHGSFSDKHVLCVTDSLEKAHEVASLERQDDGLVLPFELNEIADRLLQGYRLWNVFFKRDTSEILQVDESGFQLDEVDQKPVEGISGNERPYQKTHVWSVVARNETEAIKIASEKQQQWRANHDVSESR